MPPHRHSRTPARSLLVSESDLGDFVNGLLNPLLAALQEPRAKMYAMAQHDKSMMPGIKRPDQMITMVKKHKAAPKRRAR